jgi:hypothetical protein
MVGMTTSCSLLRRRVSFFGMRSPLSRVPKPTVGAWVSARRAAVAGNGDRPAQRQLHVEHDRHRPIVDELELHPGTEDARRDLDAERA